MNIFQQMQASPAAMAQKTYKVKSESKPVAPTSALIRPENPFSKAKLVAINPLDQLLNSPQTSEIVDEPAIDFRPFDTLSETSSPDKPTIFDKLDTKVVKNEIAQKMEKMEAENVASLKAATAKADKRLRGKKGGKIVKGVVTTYTAVSATQDY